MKMELAAHAALALAGLLAVTSCSDSPSEPAPAEITVPEPTSPANVLLALEQLYEDNGIPQSQRASAFADLLAPPDRQDVPPFRFMYGYCDIECQWDEWHFDEETHIHERMLTDDRRILLDLQAGPDYDASYIFPDMPGWRVIRADNVRISVWEGGKEVRAFTATEQFFIFAPADGRWYLAEWWERRSGSMWASFKSEFAP